MSRSTLNIKKAADQVASLYALLGFMQAFAFEFQVAGLQVSSKNLWNMQLGNLELVEFKELINAVKRLAVSTGKLRLLLTLHIRPIDPVVFREPMYRSTGNVILRRVSRLYAFSVYPGRT